MSWYVFALVDSPPRTAGRGFTSAVVSHPVGAVAVMAERRADVPPLEFDVLRQHARVVERLAARVPAILPVRFGTLVTLEELEEALGERDEEMLDALALVRGCVQMTWRSQSTPEGKRQRAEERLRPGRGGGADRAGGAAPSESERGWGVVSTSGSDYLRRRAAAEQRALPVVMRPLRTAFARLVVAERFQPASAAMPDSLYHLVPKRQLMAYRRIAAGLPHSPRMSRLTVSGPWPPYAFTPELL